MERYDDRQSQGRHQRPSRCSHAQVDISDDLAAVVGEGPMARGEVTSRRWDYIKTNKLQSADDGRQIDPDEQLAKVIGSKPISMFQMTVEDNKHIR